MTVFATNVDLTYAVFGRVNYLYFHAGKRLADRVRAKGMEIVDGDGGSGFGEAVAVGDGECRDRRKLESLRFREGAADDDGTEFAAERCVDLTEQFAAETEAGFLFVKALLIETRKIEKLRVFQRQFVKSSLQAFLQIL